MSMIVAQYEYFSPALRVLYKELIISKSAIMKLETVRLICILLAEEIATLGQC